MSSPYWSDPAAGQGGSPSWEQPPAASRSETWSHRARAEPTVPLSTGQPGSGWSPAPTWPSSATTAPLPQPEHHPTYPVPPAPATPPDQLGPGQHPVSPYPVSPFPVPYPVPYPVGYGPVPGQLVLWSDKSKAAASLLAFFLGPLGVHNFYLGHVGRGVVQLVLSLTGIGLAVTGIWVLVEFVLILTGGLRDRHGRLLR